MKKFEIGKKYQMRSPGDYNCIWKYVVSARTEKFVTLQGREGEDPIRVKVREYEGVEYCNPLGTFSLNPVLNAEKIVEDEPVKPEEQNWYFTFGSDHMFPRNYVKIFGTLESSRDEMSFKFGRQWSGQYPQSDFDRKIAAWGLEELILKPLEAQEKVIVQTLNKIMDDLYSNCWFSNDIYNPVLRYAEKMNWVKRPSTSQIHWTTEGVVMVRRSKIKE